jgi:type II secretory ATPase GspE/PulE/Tfp pilus assembly ATPase PilB-like protein
LSQLGLDAGHEAYLTRTVERPHGLFLVTGPTGSGKSTTLYAMLAQVNALERKVITVEDPVEYRLPLIRQVQVHAEIGLTFAAGLRSILRQDPDVILVGEIRDKETAEIAIRAAMTGHLVLSTIHANSAIGAITRLIDIGIDPFLITSTLCGAMGQRLVRRLCRKCRTPRPVDERERERLARAGADTADVGVFDAAGCAACGNAGFKGRVAVHEVLRMSPTLRRLVMDRATEEDLGLRAVEEGFQPIYEDALRKVAAGVTSLCEVERVVRESE